MPIEGNIKGTKKPTCNRRRHSLFPFGRTQKPLLCALYSEVDSARASARVSTGLSNRGASAYALGISHWS